MTTTTATPFTNTLADLVALTAAGWITLIVIGAAFAVGYWLSCLAWPYTACPHCDALGRVKHPSGKYWRTCHRCDGTGQQLRLGPRLFGTSHTNHRNRDRRKGHRP